MEISASPIAHAVARAIAFLQALSQLILPDRSKLPCENTACNGLMTPKLPIKRDEQAFPTIFASHVRPRIVQKMVFDPRPQPFFCVTSSLTMPSCLFFAPAALAAARPFALSCLHACFLLLAVTSGCPCARVCLVVVVAVIVAFAVAVLVISDDDSRVAVSYPRDTIYSHEAFVKSSYPPDVIVWGWNKARGTDAK